MGLERNLREQNSHMAVNRLVLISFIETCKNRAFTRPRIKI